MLARPSVIVVSDDNVAPLYLDGARGRARAPPASPPAASSCRPARQTKDFAHLEKLCDGLLAAGIERSTLLVALGGGVIGDITGFAAGILLRGLDFVQIPTTLLAQVDSSVGGKTGINTAPRQEPGRAVPPAAAGARRHRDARDPRSAAAARRLRRGGQVRPARRSDFFAWLERNGAAVCAGEPEACRRAVRTSCAAKAAIVAEDEREAGRRALLNLGHTFGHALEAETGFGDALLHGEAVAIGMVMAFALSARLGLCAAADGRAGPRPSARRSGCRPPWTSSPSARRGRAEALLAHMRHDKKVQDGRLTFILARGIGAAFVCDTVDERRRAAPCCGQFGAS